MQNNILNKSNSEQKSNQQNEIIKNSEMIKNGEMIKIKFPDGSVRDYSKNISAFEIAESISKSLAKKTLACKINGVQKDIYTKLDENLLQQNKYIDEILAFDLVFLTADDEEGLDVLRHTLAAQVLAKALKDLYNDVQLAIGPTIDNGLYYDILTSHTITPDDFEKIESKMREIIQQNKQVKRFMLAKDKAINLFLSRGENFKAEIIKSAKDDDTTEIGSVSLYKQGNDEENFEDCFVDLCRGPHLTNTGKIPLDSFKITKISGAYWRGDANNQQLQRIYCTAWKDKKDLDSYLKMMEEAEKRDHRKIGKEMELFHIQDEAVGQIFWHPRGWALYKTLQNFISEKITEKNYVEVKTPVLVDRKLWEDSGHWSKFRDLMFTSESDEDRILAIKPMNCPCHVQIFNQGTVSYKDLPVRMSEFGQCHRNEPSGSLHGLMRVRGFTQDDGHIFCSEDQVESEVVEFCDLVLQVYKELGFEKIKVKFSDRPEVRAGNDETWDKSESALLQAVKATGLQWTLNKGEGAFYGPKLEFVLTDAIGRDWQCGTLQVDFVLPERLDASYIGADDKKHRPVMLHRAILGSFERFIGILIEQYAGKFPLWLAPIQVAVATITEKQNDYAMKIKKDLEKFGIKVLLDVRNEKISYKIREHSTNKIPVILVVGDKEMQDNSVNVRRLGSQQQETLDFSVVRDNLLDEIQQRKIYNQ